MWSSAAARPVPGRPKRGLQVCMSGTRLAKVALLGLSFTLQRAKTSVAEIYLGRVPGLPAFMAPVRGVLTAVVEPWTEP